MAEPMQYAFELRELAELLVKRQELHEGRWVLGFEFGLGAGIMGGPTPEDAKPTALIQIGKIVLTKATENTPQGLPFIVDAAKINPGPGKRRKKNATR